MLIFKDELRLVDQYLEWLLQRTYDHIVQHRTYDYTIHLSLRIFTWIVLIMSKLFRIIKEIPSFKFVRALIVEFTRRFVIVVINIS